MKRISILLVMVAGLIGIDANAQKGDKKEKELKPKQQQERERSLGGQRNDSGTPVDQSNAGQTQADTVSASETGSSSQSVVERNKDQEGKPAKGTAPAVVQRTTSEGGSPSVPANGEDGRDGTNNVQRAEPNIAGAKEPGNMNLSKNSSGERNRNSANKKVRKQEELPQTDLSKREQSAGQQQVQNQLQQEQEMGSGEDELSSGDKKLSKKERRKERRKNRRSKDKDSGK